MPLVRVKNGDKKGQVFEVKEEVITLGRETTETIQILDHGVSRQHAEIFKVGEMCFVRDLNSTNGTFVNDVRVTEELLRAGDQLRIGTTVLVFEDRLPASGDEKELDIERAEDTQAEHVGSTIELKLDRTAELREKIKSLGEEVESKNLATLYEIGKIIGTEREMAGMTKRILDLAVEAVGAEGGYVFILDKTTGKLYPRATVQKGTTEEKVSKTIIKRVMQYSRSILTSDALADPRFAMASSVVMKKIKSVICAPLQSMDKVIGVLYLQSNKLEGSFTADQLELGTAIAIQAGMAITSIASAEKVRKSMTSTIRALVTAMEMKDPKRQGHVQRVADASIAVAQQLRLTKGEVAKIHLGALLHEVGKIGIATPHPDPNTAKAEYIQFGEKILANMEGFQDVLPIVKFHREHWDGSGFPNGTKGEEIPLGARIVGAAKMLDTMLTYGGVGGEGMPIKDVLIELGKQGGVQFDDKVVQALLVCHRNGTLFQPQSHFED